MTQTQIKNKAMQFANEFKNYHWDTIIIYYCEDTDNVYPFVDNGKTTTPNDYVVCITNYKKKFKDYRKEINEALKYIKLKDKSYMKFDPYEDSPFQ
jgi:hypothetical protein